MQDVLFRVSQLHQFNIRYIYFNRKTPQDWAYQREWKMFDVFCSSYYTVVFTVHITSGSFLPVLRNMFYRTAQSNGRQPVTWKLNSCQPSWYSFSISSWAPSNVFLSDCDAKRKSLCLIKESFLFYYYNEHWDNHKHPKTITASGPEYHIVMDLIWAFISC